MHLYLISQSKNNGYDVYDSAVVAARSPAAARRIHPSLYMEDWDGETEAYGSWCAVKHVEVDRIGKAKSGTEAGVICSSFNAG